jgi:hypothetical protein
VARPHKQVEREAVEHERDASESRGEIVSCPFSREKKHSKSGEPQMQQAEKTQRPRERQREINQRGRIERHGVPLREERDAALIVRIPKWQFAAPETVTLKVSEWIRKETEVTRDKSFQAKNDLRERGKNEQREEDSKTHGREKFFGEVVAAGLLHA